jgi:hypothetical protein
LDWKALLIEDCDGGGEGDGDGGGEGQSSHVNGFVVSLEVATVRLTAVTARRARRRQLRDRGDGMVF